MRPSLGWEHSHGKSGQDPVHSRKAGPCEVMNVENFLHVNPIPTRGRGAYTHQVVKVTNTLESALMIEVERTTKRPRSLDLTTNDLLNCIIGRILDPNK